jgi:hypothetical protein
MIGNRGILSSDLRIKGEPRLKDWNSWQCGTTCSQLGSKLSSSVPTNGLRVEGDHRLRSLSHGQREIVSSNIGCVLRVEVVTILVHLNGGLCGALGSHVRGVLSVEVVTELMHLSVRQHGTLSSNVGGVLGNKSRNGSTKRIIVESRLKDRSSRHVVSLSSHIEGLPSRSTKSTRVLRNWMVRRRVTELICILVDVTVGNFTALS